VQIESGWTVFNHTYFGRPTFQQKFPEASDIWWVVARGPALSTERSVLESKPKCGSFWMHINFRLLRSSTLRFISTFNRDFQLITFFTATFFTSDWSIPSPISNFGSTWPAVLAMSPHDLCSHMHVSHCGRRCTMSNAATRYSKKMLMWIFRPLPRQGKRSYELQCIDVPTEYGAALISRPTKPYSISCRKAKRAIWAHASIIVLTSMCGQGCKWSGASRRACCTFFLSPSPRGCSNSPLLDFTAVWECFLNKSSRLHHGSNVIAKNRRNWQVNFIDSGLKVAKTRFQTFLRSKSVLDKLICQIREFHAHGM